MPLIFGENAFGVKGIYSSASIQVHHCKTALCSELGQKQDLHSIEIIMMGLSDYPKSWHTNRIHSIHDYSPLSKLELAPFKSYKVSK